MPCPDKKLEASRLDFYDKEQESNDVNSVLTSTEIIDLIQQIFDKRTNLPGSDLKDFFNNFENNDFDNNNNDLLLNLSILLVN